MPTLHKNITASADIHNPKWFPDANNGDVAWRNEKGELESTDELVLPAALNFVDASLAPPTTNDGDIYVLSSGGSVNAGWGAVSLDDWVRYDLANTTWNSITPQKSSLCYDKTADKLFSYDGADWNQVGGDSIYTASGTVPTSVVATLTDTLTFDGGTVNIQGADTLSTSTAFEIYDGDTTPNKLWDWRNNGDVVLSQTTVFDSGAERIEFKSSTFNQFSIYRAVNGGGSGAAIQFNLNNSIGTKTNYAEIVALINDNTNGSEDGAIWLRNMIGGTVRTVAEIDETEFYINGSSFTTNKFRVNDNLTINKATGYTRLKGDSGLASPYPLQLYRDISVAGNGVGFEQIATNSSSSEYTYAQTVMTIEDSTAGSEDSQQRFYISSGGSLVQKMTVKSDTINFANLPTSATGLSTGDIWNDSGTLKIV